MVDDFLITDILPLQWWELTKEISRMSFEAINVLNLSIDDFLTRSEVNTPFIKSTNEEILPSYIEPKAVAASFPLASISP